MQRRVEKAGCDQLFATDENPIIPSLFTPLNSSQPLQKERRKKWDIRHQQLLTDALRQLTEAEAVRLGDASSLMVIVPVVHKSMGTEHGGGSELACVRQLTHT